jgi:hypothetical protein
MRHRTGFKQNAQNVASNFPWIPMSCMDQAKNLLF